MKKGTKEAEKLTELLREVEGHPIMQKIKAEKTAEVLAKRQEASARIEALRKEEADIIPRLQADRQEKELKYQKAKNALQAASDEFQAAHRTLSVESDQISREIGRQEQVLIETADPVIDEETTFFRGKLDYLRSPGRISSNGLASEKNIFTMKITTHAESNVDAIHEALRYSMDAIKALEKMKLEPALNIQKIQDLKEGVPDIEVYTESTGEKPMERINTDPRSLLPSDSQMEWEIGKLNEKFKKLMKK